MARVRWPRLSALPTTVPDCCTALARASSQMAMMRRREERPSGICRGAMTGMAHEEECDSHVVGVSDSVLVACYAETSTS